MATAQPELTRIRELFDCGVCFDPYLSPRILKCAHQFCEKCLQPIAQKKEQKLKITCPNCRTITVVDQLADLPKPVLLNELQELVENLATENPDSDTIDKYCNSCDVNQASMWCYNCMRCLCDGCVGRHKQAMHKVVVITKQLFCEFHPDDVVANFCECCQVGICAFCAVSRHEDHFGNGN